MTLVVKSGTNVLNSCLSCSRYTKCKDPHKSVVYSCERFKSNPSSEVDGLQRMFDMAHSVGLDPKADLDLLDPTETAVSQFKTKEFNIKTQIHGLLDQDFITSPDIKIPEGDFPQAKNFFEFATAERYLNERPYPVQVLIATLVFGEYCPRCSDMDFLQQMPVDASYSRLQKKVAFLEHGKCPHCNATKDKLIRKYGLRFYNELAACAGQRSGKSILVAMMSAYITHWYIKLQKPVEVFGLTKSQVLHGTFVALTYGQAKDNLWDPYYGYIVGSPWFADYHQMLTEMGRKYSEELFRMKDVFLSYKHRRLIFYPSGPDKRVLRGRTRILASIDELGWFDNNAMSAKVKVNGHEVYNALGRSLLTIRAKADQLMERRIYNVPTGYFLNISSPSSVRDKIMELVKLSQSSVKLYGIQRPTWEMNPNVPRSALAEEFRADPVTAMRDYGAQPPLSSSPFIGDKDTVTGIIGPRKNPCIYIHAQRKSKTSGAASRYAYISKLKKNGRPSCLAIDAGFSNNSFACVVGSLIGPKMVSLDVMIEVMPLPGVPLNYNKIYNEIMGPLIDSRNVQLTAADRWNSLKILHDIEEEYEINTRQYSVRYQDMQLFKSYCEDKQLLIPHPESADVDSVLKYDHSQYPKTFQGRPIDHFVLQMLTVQDTGASVIKGDQLTDDLVRASMLCTTMLLDEKNAELWERPDKEVAVAQQGPFAYMRGMSGGGGRSSGAGAAGNVSSQAVGFTKSLK